MRICILTSKDHIYANVLIKNIVAANPYEEFVIFESTRLLSGLQKPRALLKYLRISGWRYVITQILKSYSFIILNLVLGSIKKTSHAHASFKLLNLKNIKHIFSTSEMNGKQVVDFLTNDFKPEIILSLYCNQILKPALIAIPHFGTYNLHPALLPKYRGISATFWALVHGEVKSGITLHEVVEKIDSGGIVGQKEIEIVSGDSEHSLYMRCTRAGVDLVQTLIANVINKIKPKLSYPDTTHGSYFLPTKKAVGDFRKHGRKFWTNEPPRSKLRGISKLKIL